MCLCRFLFLYGFEFPQDRVLAIPSNATRKGRDHPSLLGRWIFFTEKFVTEEFVDHFQWMFYFYDIVVIDCYSNSDVVMIIETTSSRDETTKHLLTELSTKPHHKQPLQRATESPYPKCSCSINSIMGRVIISMSTPTPRYKHKIYIICLRWDTRFTGPPPPPSQPTS